VLELTARCNHACPHCYNAWKNPGQKSPGELHTEAWLALIDRLLEQGDIRLLTLTGGEPLLRTDLPEICAHIHGRGVGSNLVCNGSLLTAERIAALAPHGIRSWELPLLAGSADPHDRLSGSVGAFHRVTAAVAELKLAHQNVVLVFVAMRPNLDQLERVVELAVALGADGLMFNRFNPGGEGGRHVPALQASPAELQRALDRLEALSERWALPVACSIAMPPCLLDRDRYQRLGFGFCAVGTERAYYTVDPVGRLRPCNHSPTVLGDLRRSSLRELLDSPALAEFASARPGICGGCRLERSCQGGCKAAAEACCGSAWEPDPFLAAHQRAMRRP